MISALGRPANAIQGQMQRFDGSAARVAESGHPDYVQEEIEQMSAANAIKANIAVVKTTDALVGTLFDIVA
jgi:hypothetical protein